MVFMRFVNCILGYLFFGCVFGCVFGRVVYADDLVVEVALQNHIFTPSEIHVPTKTKIILAINNLDPTIEEFDSSSLRREKILRSNTITKIVLAPLAEGRYDFVGEFHSETAKGTIIVNDIDRGKE